MAMMAHENWSSRFGFLMASVGFAVGLGNIWRFPYIAGENGGGAFVLIYLICAFGIAMPILMSEIMIGRRGQQSPNVSMGIVARLEGVSPRWHWLGAMTMWTAFLILLFYTVVAGWVFQYLYLAGLQSFNHLLAPQDSLDLFNTVLASPGGMFFWTAVVLAICCLIVSAGVQAGIERTVKILMPMLFLLLIGMVGYAALAADFAAGLRFMFEPDFSQLTPAVVLVAIGQAFFSVGVAMAGIMAYGAYLPKRVSIGQSALVIVTADTLVAILAGLVIFPLVFQYGLAPDSGPGLIFRTLPLAFAQMPGGHLFSVLFFLLLAVAAVTSIVGLLEPIMSWAEEHRGISRRKGGLLLGVSLLLLSLMSILSYNQLANFYPLGGFPVFAEMNINDILGFMTDHVMLPLGGLLIAVFAGWFLSPSSAREELAPSAPWHFLLWRVLIRYIVPPAVFLMLLLGIGG